MIEGSVVFSQGGPDCGPGSGPETGFRNCSTPA